MDSPLVQTIALHKKGQPIGMFSVCSANPFVLAAAMHFSVKHRCPILIEATSNQVNPFGGYTGMVPHQFVKLIKKTVDSSGCPRECISLGGDHLGPLPWRHEQSPILDETLPQRCRCIFKTVQLQRPHTVLLVRSFRAKRTGYTPAQSRGSSCSATPAESIHAGPIPCSNGRSD